MTTHIIRASLAKFFANARHVTTLILVMLTAAPALLARDYGTDVSHYQGESGISQASWNQKFAAGKRFTFIKATEGLTGPDDNAMANNVARATAAGFLVGVYHYAHPENRPTTSGAVLEADHFLGYAGSAIVPGRLRPVLDVEGSSANLSTTALTDWVIAFSDRIIAQRGPGAAPIIYCTRSYARYELDSRLANYDLWLAYYTNVDLEISQPPPTAAYPDPTGVFNNWTFWQYTSSGSSGGISPLDLNVCHSEYKSLTSFLIPHPTIILSSSIGANGAFQFSFTNTPGRAFTAIATTNLSLPHSDWTVLGAIVEGPAGSFHFTDTPMTNTAVRFYGVRLP